MSDIVTRLWGNTVNYPGFENIKTEAAREIERLRARVAELEAECADYKKLIADELAETFKLFGILGLNTADDFGTKTAIVAVRERIEVIKADRDRWKAEAMAAREYIHKDGEVWCRSGSRSQFEKWRSEYESARAANGEVEG